MHLVTIVDVDYFGDYVLQEVVAHLGGVKLCSFFFQSDTEN
jgi:hypothetical protein